jgi:hypothetical protein
LFSKMAAGFIWMAYCNLIKQPKQGVTIVAHAAVAKSSNNAHLATKLSKEAYAN